MGEPQASAEAKILTAEQVFKTQDIPDAELVNVPEWGGSLYVRVMSGTERDRWELMVEPGIKSKNANVRAALVAMCACDANGKRVFSDGQAAQLGSKSSVALDRLFSAAQRINKIRDADIEELEKN